MQCSASMPCAHQAGALIRLLGRWPPYAKLSALALAGSLIPTTWAGHTYWTIEDPVTRKLQRVQFHKNMAMIGGLIFAVVDGSRPVEASRTLTAARKNSVR